MAENGSAPAEAEKAREEVVIPPITDDITPDEKLAIANGMIREAQEQMQDMSTRAVNAKAQQLSMSITLGKHRAENEKLRARIKELEVELEKLKTKSSVPVAEGTADGPQDESPRKAGSKPKEVKT